MDYLSLIALGVGSTLGFIMVYRNFELHLRGRVFVLLISGIIILAIDVFWALNSIYLHGIEQDQVVGELLLYLSFHFNIDRPRYEPLLLAYLLIIWACLGTIVNRIIQIKKTNQR